MMKKIDYDAQTQAVIDDIRTGKLSQGDGTMQLLELHNGLIHRLLAGYGLEADEERNIGFLAIHRCISYWDSDKGSFGTVLQWTIRSEVRKLLRGCAPSDTAVISLQTPIADSDQLMIQDTIPCETDFEEIAISETEREALRLAVQHILLRMPKQQRIAITERFFEGQKVNDRSTYQKAMRTISTARNRRILSQYLERNDYFSGTGLSNFRRTGSTMPERIIIQIHDGR